VSFLLDTNVVSETMKKEPNHTVLDWMARQVEETLFISAITLGELRRGALLLAEGQKRRSLLHWIETGIKLAFADRILSVDTTVMEHWAQLQVRQSDGLVPWRARSAKAGRRLSVMDSLIGATALAHDLTLATRNTTDFQSTKVSLLNPWRAG
jgi:predicted nucleic acid-binding protein